MEFHISHFPPTDVWPEGGWSLYQISGDEIAERTVRERVNPKGWYEGEVIARHPWCGYVGLFVTLDEVMATIKELQKESLADSEAREAVEGKPAG